MRNTTLEHEIETYLSDRVVYLGGEVRKVKWLGRRGAPDRLVMLRGGHFIELKRPGGFAEEHQRREHVKMRAHGLSVLVLANRVEVDMFLKEIMK